MNSKTLISLSGGVISNPLRRLPFAADFELREGENIALVGPCGSGKSTLLEMLRGGFYLREGSLRLNFDCEAYKAIRTVEFDNAYSTSEVQYYHQQRWQAFEREAAPLCGDMLREAARKAAAGAGDSSGASAIAADAATSAADAASITAPDPFTPWQKRLFETLNIAPLMGKAVITLSSGELRRFHIAKALLSAPKVLILESPFIGLDPPTRQILDELMQQVTRELGISFILTLTESGRMPAAVSHVYFLDGKSISPKMTAAEAREKAAGAPKAHFCEPGTLPLQHDTPLYGNVVQMRGVNISYGERQIFRDLDWCVRSGEKWNVTGPNGSGKSTLLSLVNADNPAAYSLDITLFDRRRGSGESIWDIKRHIGYLSSEMHSSYRTPDTVLEVLRGGLSDRFGGLPSAGAGEAEDAALMQWLSLFGAEHLAGRNYLTLSSGEQRYVLLVRAFVKNPDLLILDEPFQGLDPVLRSRAAAVISAYCRQQNKTLIFVTHYIEELPSLVTHTLSLAHLKTL